MIRPRCDKCKEELEEFGAILLGPPDFMNLVRKWHLCKRCFEKLLELFDLSL